MPDDADFIGRTPPRDLAAERSALGACMLSPIACAEVLAAVAPDAFYLPQHVTIYNAIAGLFLAGEPVD
ncbi:DnaB-like helicase N-terminal domain-containing protein, partial [Streptomyces sp. NPDC003832]